MAQFYPDGMREVNLNTVNTNSNGNFVTPPPQDFNTEAMQGSIQHVLSENIGEYVVVEFLIGTQTTTQKQGILYAVGTSFLVLYEETSQTFVVCDIFSVKFITFYLPGQRPGASGNGNFSLSQVSDLARQNAANNATSTPPAGGCGYRALSNPR